MLWVRRAWVECVAAACAGIERLAAERALEITSNPPHDFLKLLWKPVWVGHLLEA